jgi:GxxExxY protein
MEHGSNTDKREILMELLHKDITEQIIGAAFEVHRVLGYGFLEKVYQQAMVVELRLRGLSVEPEAEIDVWYKDVRVAYYEADLFAENCVIVELKVAKDYQKADEAQLINELKATGIKVGLLINSAAKKSNSNGLYANSSPSPLSVFHPWLDFS